MNDAELARLILERDGRVSPAREVFCGVGALCDVLAGFEEAVLETDVDGVTEVVTGTEDPIPDESPALDTTELGPPLAEADPDEPAPEELDEPPVDGAPDEPLTAGVTLAGPTT